MIRATFLQNLCHSCAMTFDILTALILFALASSLTPGPNNLMLKASGANFGFLRSIPHVLGISIGFLVLMGLTGLGLVQVFDRSCQLHGAEGSQRGLHALAGMENRQGSPAGGKRG